METIEQDGRVARLTRQLVEFALHGKNSLPPSTLLDAVNPMRVFISFVAPVGRFISPFKGLLFFS
jgi:hypothetical protein